MSVSLARDESLYALIRSRFPRDTEAPFLERPDGRAVSYGEAERVSGRIASLLVSLGVVKGDRIAVQVEKSPEAVLLYLACQRVGAIYLPLNTGYTRNEVSFFLEDAAPRLFVCRPDAGYDHVDTAIAAGVAHVLTLGEHGDGTLVELARAMAADFASVPAAADDIAAILYTSGTTGRSKGAMLSHRNLAANAEALVRAWEFTADDVLLHALPLYHTHGLFVALHCTLLTGGRCLFLNRFDPADVLRLLPRATVMMGVPTFYTRLLADAALTPERCVGMRLFTSGSAPLLAETHRSFAQRTGHAILERYGMTETGMLTSNPLVGERVPGSVGPALPGVEVRAVDEEGHAVPVGEPGMVEVRGANVFSGYWNRPERQDSDFRPDGFFITGDIGRLDARGYLTLVGRAKDLIISGGLNVYPSEVEAVLDRLPGVWESAVIGVPHPDFGEAVVAVVACGSVPPQEAAVVAGARASLAAFKVPKAVIMVPDLPRNAMGKVQKALLRDQHQGIFQAPADDCRF